VTRLLHPPAAFLDLSMRILLTVLMLLVALPAAAHWLELGEDSAFRYHIDPDSLRGDRYVRTVTTLFNVKATGQQVQSMRILIEADCKIGRTRVLSRTVHSQPMAGGVVLALPFARSTTWDFARPGSANEVIRTHVCAASDAEMIAAIDRSAPKDRPQAERQTTGPISVPLVRQGGTFAVPVLVNEAISLRFIVDSGASDVNIPTDVVNMLIRDGVISPSDFLGRKPYVLADGSRIVADTFRIRAMRIGNRVVEDVTATVGSASSPFLLGQSFLRRFRSWSIDNAREALVLE